MTMMILCGFSFIFVVFWVSHLSYHSNNMWRDIYYIAVACDDWSKHLSGFQRGTLRRWSESLCVTHTKAYWFIYTQLFFLRKYDICRWSESLCCYTHGAYWFIYTLFFFFRKYDILLLVKSPLDPYHSTWNEIMCMDVYECYDELTRYDSEERKVVSHPTVKWLLFY